MYGIKSYYKGINDMFQIINKDDSIKEKFPIIKIPDEIKEKDDKSFESIVGQCVMVPIKNIIFNYAQTFCNVDGNKKTFETYPDCVETTVRNFINLLCFNGTTFDINILQRQFKNINKHTIEYYDAFNNYDLQMSTTITKNIYGKELNARDAWSYLIIYYANTNLHFRNDCKDNDNNVIRHNIASGYKTVDDNKSNFFQLLQNLLSDEIKIDTWKKQISKINPKLLRVDDYDEDEDEEAEAEAEDEEDELELFEVEIKGKTYVTNDEMQGDIYEYVNDEVGEIVGTFKNGVAKFAKKPKPAQKK